MVKVLCENICTWALQKKSQEMSKTCCNPQISIIISQTNIHLYISIRLEYNFIKMNRKPGKQGR